MKTGCQGTFVISWAQVRLDGQDHTAPDMLRIGMEWSWTGSATRVDGPDDILPLAAAQGADDLHHRAAQTLRKLRGKRFCQPKAAPTEAVDTPLHTAGFAVTDGRDQWSVSLLDMGPGQQAFAVFAGDLPPRDRDLWVVRHSLAAPRHPAGGMICFTPGTLIATETGLVPVECLTEGCRVQTKDDGCQDLLWIGNRRLTGARLYAMPHLRPIRISAGALGPDAPAPGLVVSPDHRIILRGPHARALFNSDEVLVRARDLINDHTVRTDHTLREVTYIHLLLPSHQIVFANGVETESFHPAGAALDSDQWAALEGRISDLRTDPATYGPHARRALTPGEAAILRHDLR
jgi:hypothetical protein